MAANKAWQTVAPVDAVKALINVAGDVAESTSTTQHEKRHCEENVVREAGFNSARKRSGSEADADLETFKKRKISPEPEAAGVEATTASADGGLEAVDEGLRPDSAASASDTQSWPGYCEIESEPAYFSVILRQIGITGLTVRELPMLDENLLAGTPSPIFGLVLLFRHREFDVENQAEECPERVWFANQMPGQNSCATLAMIHTVLNLPEESDIDIGEHMRQFREFSMDLTPFQRGEAFASWQFVKKIHNSFAKNMDILENDAYLAHKVQKAQLASSTGNRRKSEDSTSSGDSGDFETNAHHYLAFVPINGTVYKLDGMDAQPTAMGKYDTDCPEMWIPACAERISTLLASGGDDYGMFAIAQSPLVDLRGKICEADNTRNRIDLRLSSISTNWTDLVPETDREPTSPGFLEGFTPEARAQYPVPPSIAAAIASEDLANLLDRRAALIEAFRELVNEYLAEEGNEQEENEAAEARRWDYGPVIQRWLEMLVENGWLKDNMSEFVSKEN